MVQKVLTHFSFTAQAFPQLPQFATSDANAASQPSAARLLQLAKPALQVETAHVVPFMQVGVPLATVHALPQPPQFVVVVSAASQPFDPMTSQSPKPALQPNPHVELAQNPIAFAGCAHAVPHIPQLAGSLANVTQLFPHFAEPPRQLRTQLPPWHTSPDAQTLLHVPQLLRSLFLSTQMSFIIPS